MTEYHVNPSLTPEENTDAAIASLKERGLWDERPEWHSGVWEAPKPEPKAQQELVLVEGDA